MTARRLFGASTGAASALRVAAKLPADVRAVVSRGGRPDLTGNALLPRVQAATLLIVGGHDYGVVELNEDAHRLLRCEKTIAIVPGATHLFEEPGTLDEVARLATDSLSVTCLKEKRVGLWPAVPSLDSRIGLRDRGRSLAA